MSDLQTTDPENESSKHATEQAHPHPLDLPRLGPKIELAMSALSRAKPDPSKISQKSHNIRRFSADMAQRSNPHGQAFDEALGKAMIQRQKVNRRRFWVIYPTYLEFALVSVLAFLRRYWLQFLALILLAILVWVIYLNLDPILAYLETLREAAVERVRQITTQPPSSS